MATRNICCVIIFVCVFGSVVPVPNYITPSLDPATYQGALETCLSQGEGYGLATPQSITEQRTIAGMLSNTGKDSAFIALKRKNLDHFTWTDGSRLEEGKQLPGQGTPGHDCVTIHSENLTMVASPCVKTTSYFLCKYRGSAGRRGNCGEMSGHTFCILRNQRNWYTARSQCQREDGDLAVIDLSRDRRDLAHLLSGLEGLVWIGLRRVDWAFHETVRESHIPVGKFTPWDHDQPVSDSNAQCVVASMGSRTAWRAVPCTERHHVLCQQYNYRDEQPPMDQTLYVIIGAVVAGVFLIIFIIAGVCYYKRYYKKGSSRGASKKENDPKANPEEKIGLSEAASPQ